MRNLLLVAFALLGTFACGRAPGPNDDEIGQEIVWEIIPSRRTESPCAAGGPMADFTPKMQHFDSDTLVYYLIYSADPGRRTATAASCPEPIVTWEDCAPGTDKWKLSGHTLTLGEEAGTAQIASGCTMAWKHTLTLVDQGDTGSFNEDVSYSLSGDASSCAAFDAEMKRESTSGKGVDGCTSSIRQGLMFALTKAW